MLREILEQLPPAEKTQLMSAFNGGFSYRVEYEEYYIGVYQPPMTNALDEVGAWTLWEK